MKALTFVFKSSTGHNIDFIYRKKASELRFCSVSKICVLMVSKLLDLSFFALEKVHFPQSRKCSTKIWSRKFSTENLIKKSFHSQGDFHKKFDQGHFPQLRIFSSKFFSLNQKSFPQTTISGNKKSKRFSKSSNFRSIQF